MNFHNENYPCLSHALAAKQFYKDPYSQKHATYFNTFQQSLLKICSEMFKIYL